MARANSKGNSLHKAEKNAVSSTINKTEVQKATMNGQSIWIWMGISLLLTLIAYLPAFHAGFVNWDDDDYVVKNFLIRDLSNLKALITTPVQGNYHPLTMISLAINYAISELDPSSYHLFNILLHLLNVLLVFKLVFQLSKENTLIAFTCALLFGVHPMHVESVAWVSERKDVLFTFFFLLGLMSYLKFSDTNSDSEKSGASSRYYVMSLLFLVLSLSAKPAAVVFPVLLLCFDFLRGRKFALKLIIEKIPYFILALVFGLLTMQAQKTIGATGIEGFYSFGSRMFFGFYGYMMYFVKLIAPFDLAAFIPYPAVNQSLPIAYLISPLFFLLTLVLCIRTWKKYREITFAFAFYLINLILVLQFIPVGSAIIADRYTYVPYIGLFYLLGWAMDNWKEKLPLKPQYIVVILGLIFTLMSYRQASTWENSATLWDQAIAHAPSAKAYSLRAMLLRKEGNVDKALEYYNQALLLNKADQDIWVNRGNVYADLHRDSLAMNDYNTALSLKPDFMMALKNRASLNASHQKFEEALIDLNKILSRDSLNYETLRVRGQVYFSTRQYENAIRDFMKCASYDSNPADLYEFMGVAYLNLGNFDASLQALNKSISMKPSAETYLNRSFTYKAMGKINEAREDAQRAIKGGRQIDPAYLAQLGL